MPGQCTGPKILSKSLGNWGRRYVGGHDLVRRMDRQEEVLIWCKLCSGYARQRMGPKACELLKTGTNGHQRIWQNDEKNQNSRRMKSPSQRGKELENRGRKEKNYEKEVSVLNNFETEGFNGTKSLVEFGKGENHERKRGVA